MERTFNETISTALLNPSVFLKQRQANEDNDMSIVGCFHGVYQCFRQKSTVDKRLCFVQGLEKSEGDLTDSHRTREHVYYLD